jgi:hypothetical protein
MGHRCGLSVIKLFDSGGPAEQLVISWLSIRWKPLTILVCRDEYL